MAKNICMGLGVLFVIVGLLGFIDHRFLGMHLNNTHNVVHLVTGALAIWFAMRGHLSARRFSRVFGIVYLLLGIVGLFSGANTFSLDFAAGTPDDHLFKLIPGYLEFGTSDSAMHTLLGAIFAIAGFTPRRTERRMESAADQTRERAGMGR